MRIVAFLIECWSWFKIVLSPVMVAGILAAVILAYSQSTFAVFVSIILVVSGFIAGIKWANMATRKQGATNFLSRISSTPELNKKENDHVK
ncbi:MAG: hypothetical protein ACK5UI_06490 [Bacteroidota bacterium]|jgi:hypothetical protein